MIRIHLLVRIDLAFTGSHINAVMEAVIDYLVGSGPGYKAGDRFAGSAVENHQFAGIAADYKQPLVGLVEGQRRVFLGFVNGPAVGYFARTPVNDGEVVLVGDIDKEARAGVFQRHSFDMGSIYRDLTQ